MIRQHDIKWFMEDPHRFLMMRPFTRGGVMNMHGWEGADIYSTTMMETGFTNLSLHPISQDLFLTEYSPDLHHIILNKAIPKIKVVYDGVALPSYMMEMTQTASFQKLIHAAHVRNLTVNPTVMNLCSASPNDNEKAAFSRIKQEWTWRNRELDKYNSIKNCKKVGNCAMLFSYEPSQGRYSVTNYSYEDGYQIISNYDEYGIEISRSLAYQIDGRTIIDVFDNKLHYRCVEGERGWETTSERHGFSRCPLLHKRGRVAWEYAESPIEMWELMTNINAIALKRFGTFALVFVGDMDTDSFKRDSSTLIINLSSDQTNGKQDAKVLDFPEPKTMDGYLKTLEEKISLFSSTSFITPKDISTTNSGGNGIALAMSNDYAVATQSALDWQRYLCDMVYLHQEGLDLEENGVNHYSDLKISAKIVPWSLETNNTKITNLTMEGAYLSTQTIIENCPDAAPDEIDRVVSERGSVVARSDNNYNGVDKAYNMSVNRSDEIVDNVKKDDNIKEG